MNINQYASQLQNLSIQYANQKLPYPQYCEQRKVLLDQLDQQFNGAVTPSVNDQTQRYHEPKGDDVTEQKNTNNEINQGPLGRFINKLKK